MQRISSASSLGFDGFWLFLGRGKEASGPQNRNSASPTPEMAGSTLWGTCRTEMRCAIQPAGSVHVPPSAVQCGSRVYEDKSTSFSRMDRVPFAAIGGCSAIRSATDMLAQRSKAASCRPSRLGATTTI